MCKYRDFKIKLIFPCGLESHKYNFIAPYYYFPYGMGTLTAFLRQRNYYVEQEDLSKKFNRNNGILSRNLNTIDLDLYSNLNEIHRFFESGDIEGKLSLSVDKVFASTSIEGFDVIGFSIFSIFHFIFALMLSKKIKQFTNTPIVFGGAFISIYGHLYPDIFNFVDYVIVGDGRIPLLKLIDYLNNKISISEVPNLSYKKGGKLITNFQESYLIEEMSIPDFDGLSMKLYKNKSPKGDYILLPYCISRGCTGRCSFCIHRRINEKLEFKSYNKVINDLKQMKERYKSKKFHFCDSAINNSYEYLEGLCDAFIKNKLNIDWRVYARVGNLDKHILRKMKEAGCHALNFGIESGSDNILEKMNKGFTAEQASRVLKESSEKGIQNNVFLIAGYPHETKEDIRQTIEFIKRNNKYIHYMRTYKFLLYFGSAMYFCPDKYGITNLTPLPSRFCLAFDESKGLKWEQKQKQQENSRRQIIKAIHNYKRFNKFIALFRRITFKIKHACRLIPFLYNLDKLRRNQWCSLSKLKKLQEDKLEALLLHAYCKTDYYRKLFDQVGIKPRDIKSIQDLTRIPITTRKELQALPKKAIIATNIDSTHCLNLRTSGSTGIPLDVFVNDREIINRKLLSRRMYFENSGRLADRLAHITIPQNFTVNQWYQDMGILKTKYISVFDEVESQLKAILEFKPAIIRSYSSTLKNLAIEIKNKKIKGINPRIIFSTAELLTREDREFIASTFQAELFDYYACNECGVIAWECKEHLGYHINIENVIVEFIKEDGRKAKYGEEGEIVITSLNSYAMPFIRYKLGDIGVPSDEKCPCGRTLPLLKIIAGRSNDRIISSYGAKIYPYFITCSIENIPGISQYQMIQERKDKVKINIVKNSNFSYKTIFEIQEICKDILGCDVKIETSIVEKMPSSKTGKFQIIKSELQ